MNLRFEHMVYIFLIFLGGCNTCPETYQPTGTELSSDCNISNDTLRILCTQDQLDLTVKLTDEFQKCHGKIITEISLYERMTPKEIMSQGRNDLVLVSDAYAPNIPDDFWRTKYARDGVIGIINKSNPFCKKITESGLGKQQLASLLTGVRSDGLKQVQGYDQYRPIKVFICSDEFLPCKLWTDFIGITLNDLNGVRTVSFQDLIDSIRTEPLSMGFCCQRYAYDPLTRMEIEEIKVIPIDCNANGTLEDKEKFYDNLDMLRRAMWLGTYPCHSFLNYYIIASEKPTNRLHIDFIKWVLTEGQKELHAEGYIMLNTRIINTEIYKLNELLASL
ncbi:MAG: hypothetical protein AMS26_16650 [Bacteroides sp. SM23_62]|nr:MAG: hypothetical protein AMS26_16650 [Bacteroides sp. SM23_62]